MNDKAGTRDPAVREKDGGESRAGEESAGIAALADPAQQLVGDQLVHLLPFDRLVGHPPSPLLSDNETSRDSTGELVCRSRAYLQSPWGCA